MLQTYKVTQESDWVESERLFRNKRTLTDDFPVDELSFPKHIWLYMNHLNALNLAGTYQEGNQEVIRDDAGKQTGVKIYSNRYLTDFGSLFCEVCVPDDWKL